jgi:hypothetical protein
MNYWKNRRCTFTLQVMSWGNGQSIRWNTIWSRKFYILRHVLRPCIIVAYIAIVRFLFSVSSDATVECEILRCGYIAPLNCRFWNLLWTVIETRAALVIRCFGLNVTNLMSKAYERLSFGNILNFRCWLIISLLIDFEWTFFSCTFTPLQCEC